MATRRASGPIACSAPQKGQGGHTHATIVETDDVCGLYSFCVAKRGQNVHEPLRRSSPRTYGRHARYRTVKKKIRTCDRFSLQAVALRPTERFLLKCGKTRGRDDVGYIWYGSAGYRLHLVRGFLTRSCLVVGVTLPGLNRLSCCNSSALGHKLLVKWVVQMSL